MIVSMAFIAEATEFDDEVCGDENDQDMRADNRVDREYFTFDRSWNVVAVADREPCLRTPPECIEPTDVLGEHVDECTKQEIDNV